MFKMWNIVRMLTLFQLMLVLVSCDAEELIPGQDGDAVLSVQLKVPDIGVELKGVSSNPLEPDTWSSWERAVDGRYLYRVSAFLISGDRLVATKDLKLTGEPSEATLEFEGNFTHGNYRLMVVANYSAHAADDGSNGIKSYGGITDFTATIESLMGKTNVDYFTTLYENSFMMYQLNSTGGVCERVPQVLSLVKDIELHPGVNYIEGKLLRTYSRVRIVAENHSDEELSISALSLSNIFTQKRAYIFPGNGYIQDKTTVDVTSEDAITPFTANTTAPLIIPGRSHSVLFDAYILESSRSLTDEEYSYSLSLGYNNLVSYTLSSTTQINSPSNVVKGHYLLYNPNSRRYLTSGASSALTSTLSSLSNGMELSDEYVWYLDNTRTNGTTLGSNQFYIGTANADVNNSTSYYLVNPIVNGIVGLGDLKSTSYIFADRYDWYQRRYFISLASSDNGLYIGVDGSSVEGYNRVSSNCNFILYRVTPHTASKDIIVPVNTIDPNTGQAVTTQEISRNDFINAVVLIKFNKNKGHFEFEVKDWESGGGDVDFN